MKIFNLYDFDKTILRKDSLLMFYFFNIKKRIWLFWHVFVLGFVALFCALKIMKFEKLKETLLFPFKFSKQKQKDLETFAVYAQKFCNEFYLNQKREDDVVCSASPTFLVKAIMKKLNSKAVVVASNISLDTLKFLKGEKNCKGARKIVALKKYFGEDELIAENSFSDSLSDMPLFLIATKKAFLVKKGRLELFMENGEIVKK